MNWINVLDQLVAHQGSLAEDIRTVKTWNVRAFNEATTLLNSGKTQAALKLIKQTSNTLRAHNLLGR